MNAHTGTALVRRATVEEIVGYRNRALELYARAFDAIAEADAKIKEAADMARRVHPGTNSYNYHHERETAAFYEAVKLPDRDLYLRIARKLIDISAWSWIIERTDLERLMDHEAKQQLRNQMAYVPERPKGDREIITGEEIERGLPELTVENVMATLDQFMLDADTIFRRGIANAFSKLDRRFRSHDGFKIGSRLILTHVFDRDSGRLNWGSVRDQLIDIERAFAVLDGRPESGFTSALYAIEQDRHYDGPKQTECETNYFRIKGYKNGNAHLWFQRDELVEKVNKLLAEYYGEVIGDGQTQDEDPLDNIKTTPAKRYGFYPTPDYAAEKVIEHVPLLQKKTEPALTILEPSAGTGNLARRCIVKPLAAKGEQGWRRKQVDDREYRFDNKVDCVEIQPALAQSLLAERIFRTVYTCDFLALSPKTTGLYDRVVMNPPFDRERDIDHVVHALDFLKPDGKLVAIMSAGTEFRQTKKSIAFRDLMKSLNARFDDLPAGSFSSVGTNCNTIIVAAWKDGRAGSSWQHRRFE
jgi:hypothetical protein